ncbi:MAG TPA: aldo/keto reductase [Candidatus Binatia bacterium]|nr:aldo/keto reductase [Candidatus Binatia bacterium]
MEYRKFGTTEFKVPPMGLGCMSMSGSYGPADDAESIATLHRAFDLGINFLDTSASYGNGHNHELIARALKGRRERIIIHSKSGSPRTPEASGDRGGSNPEYLIKTCEESLGRLKVDVLDMFCMSRVDPKIPIEESVGGMARLVEQGKVRYIGLSEASATSIRRAQKVHPIVSLQMEYSLWSRDPESSNIAACREFGMGFMAYSPLGRGFLAGMFHDSKEIPDNDSRRNHPRFRPGNIEHNLQLLARLEQLAKEKSATPAQLALAWLMAQGSDIIPIPSSKSRRHLEENLKAMDIKLTKDDLARLDAILPPGAAAGPRTKDMDRVNV